MDFILNRLDHTRPIRQNLAAFEEEFGVLSRSSGTSIEGLKALISRVNQYALREIPWERQIPADIRASIFSLQERISTEISRQSSPPAAAAPPVVQQRKVAWAGESIAQPLRPLPPTDDLESNFMPAIKPIPKPKAAPITAPIYEPINPLLAERTTFVFPFLLRKCPEEFKEFIADAILVDWKACALINSSTLFDTSLGTYEIDRVVWGLKETLDQVDSMISAISKILLSDVDNQASLLELQRIFAKRKELLVGLYRRAIETGSRFTIENNVPHIDNVMNKYFTYCVVEQRITLHRENLAYMQKMQQEFPNLRADTKPVEKEIAQLEFYKQNERLLPTTSEEIGLSFYKMYDKNHLLERFFLLPTLLSSLKTRPSYERDMFALQLGYELAEVKQIFDEAKTIFRTASFPNKEIKEAYELELKRFRDNCQALQQLQTHYYDLSAEGTFENDLAIAAYLQQAPIDRNLSQLIKERRIALSESNATVNERANELHPQTVALYS